MSRPHRLAAFVLALALVVPAAAYAGPVREYQLQYSPAGDSAGALMIVSALVDPQVTLPVTITIPVPKGATLLWAGEILGGDPAADPVRDTTMAAEGDMDVYTLTLEQAYTAQLEIQLPPAKADSRSLEASVAWTNPGDEVMVTGSVVAEPGATGVKTTPKIVGDVRTNGVGESLYPVEGRRVPTGDVFEIEVSWKRGGEAAAKAAADSPLLPVLLMALVAAVLALVAVLGRERTRARRAAALE